MQSSGRKDAVRLKRSASFTELSEASTSEQLVAWLRNLLGDQLFATVDFDDVEASDVLACENVEELALLFSTSEEVASMIAATVLAQKRVKTATAEYEGTGENSDPNECDTKPNLDKLKASAQDTVLPDQHVAHEDPGLTAMETDAINVDPVSTASADKLRQHRELDGASDRSDEHIDGNEDAEDDDDEDDDGDGDDADGLQAANGVEDDNDDDINTAPDHMDGVILQRMENVVLPDDKAAAMCYVEKALRGLDCSEKDKNKRKKHKKHQVRYVQNLLGAIDSQIQHCLGDDQRWKARLEDLLNRVKQTMHDVLSKAVMQRRTCFTDFVLRVIPYDVQEQEIVTDAGDGSDDKKTKSKRVAAIDDAVLERLWAIWQELPLFCTIKCPIQVKQKQLIKSFKESMTWTGPMLHSVFESKKALRSPVGEQTNKTSTSVMSIMNQILWHRFGRSSLNIRNGTLLPCCHRVVDAAYDADGYQGYQMTFKFFLEAGQASIELEEGMSSFVRLIEESQEPAIHVLELIQHSEEFKGTRLALQSQAFCQEYGQIVDALKEIEPDAEVQNAQEPVRTISNRPVEGSMFKQLLGMVSNMDNQIPEDLKELLLPHLKHDLYDHQLASLHFVRKEEAAQDGLQRHFWWRVSLPSDPSLVCYISPHFNAIWWATDADLLHCWDFANKASIDGVCPVRCSQGFKLTGSESKGGMLALDMGMGKTPVMLAAHSLEQHLIPSEPQRLTQWTDEQLRQHKTVLVGKDVDTQKEVEMYTGFKQADDLKRSIVPDGSVRFTGRGNLVVAPRTLLGQWSSMIDEHTKQDHTVCVLEGIKERREYMTSVAGLAKLATYDWVILSPGIVPKDIDMLRAIDWRRVIADEAHQLSGSCTAAMGINKAQRETSLMQMLASIPAVQGHWCLTGTPLRSYRQVGSLDRIFCALSTGIGTVEHLHNATLVLFVSSIAIRYDKQGFIKGKECLKLPPLYDETRRVRLTDEDRTLHGMVRERLIKDSEKVEIGWVLEKQAEFAADEDQSQFVPDEEEDEDEDDEDDEHGRKKRPKKARKVVQKDRSYNILRDVVDPLRKSLSAASDMYFRGTAETGIIADVDNLVIGEPPEVKKPRRKKDDPPFDHQAWKEKRQRILATKYTPINITSKVDTVVDDIKSIMEEGMDELGRFPKIIIYSNFAHAFVRIKSFLENEDICYASLMGSMSLKRRMEALDAFKENENVPVFLLNKQCGAVGLNLTIATHIMILESSWNPVWEEQAISRAHRMGQKGPIQVIRYLAEDTVDSRLHDMMKATAARDDSIKTQLQDAVEMKGAFEADETALNKTICTCFKPAALAAMIGDLDDSSDEEESQSDGDE